MASPTVTTPYPSALPLAECMDVVNFIRGSSTDQAKFCHSAWVVVGYGLSQWQPAPMTTPKTTDTRAQAEKENEVAEKLEKAVKSHQQGVGATAIPWATILPIIIQIVLQLLQKKSGDDDEWKRPDGMK